MSEEEQPLKGIFEGYLKKHKNTCGLTIFVEYTKRYFCLNSPRFQLLYFKNRKKTGTPSDVPLKEILGLKKADDKENDKINSKKEWGYEFYMWTRHRTYLFNAFSYNDREIWLDALRSLLNYK